MRDQLPELGRSSREFVERVHSHTAVARRVLDIYETIQAEFNASAEEGRDPAFGKGSRAYNRYQGDALHGPNPCIAPIKDGFGIETRGQCVGTTALARRRCAWETKARMKKPVLSTEARTLEPGNVPRAKTRRKKTKNKKFHFPFKSLWYLIK